MAAEFLRRESVSWLNSEVRIDESFAFDGNDGNFVFGYNAVDFLDHGREEAELGGNMPICVNSQTGECRFLSLKEVFDYVDRGLIR